MVGKLIKYEFLRTRAPLALGGGIGLAIGLVAYALTYVSSVVATIPFFAGFTIAIVFTFGVQIYLAIDFYRSSFGRRGYFTHTLPVKGTTLVLTKLGYALLVTLAAIAWTIVLLFVSLATAVRLHMITYEEFWDTFSGLFGNASWFVWFMLLNIVALVLATLVQYYFAVAVGSEAWINRAGAMGPVVTFLIVYVVFQVLALVAFLIPPSYNPLTEVWSWSVPLVDMVRDPDTVGIPISAFWISYVLSGLLLWRTVVSVNKKLELR